MFLYRKSLEEAGLAVEVTDEAISIHGTQPMPSRVHAAVDAIAQKMGWTPREHDDLVNHIADITVWSILKKLSD